MRGGAASRMPRFPARGGPTNRPQRSCRGRIPATGQGGWGTPVSPSPCARAAPSPSRGRGVGKRGFPIPLLEGQTLLRAGTWGNRVPHPPAHGLRPYLPAGGGVGKRGFPIPLIEGQTLLRAGGWGNLVPPCSPQPSMRLAPHPDGMKKGSSWESCALANPPTGGGMGKPGFPIPLPGGGVGKPGFPIPLLQQPMFTSGLWRIMPGCLKSPAEEPAHD